uniref:DUF7583 domain-containing protein n=1 Tax=Strongyloides papillosus TaxID=174720 RepID=A0A0N5BVD2_STREA
MSTNGITHLKTILFNNKRFKIQSLQRTNDKLKENFMFYDGIATFKNKNPSGTIYCTCIYPIREFNTSQLYKSFKDKDMITITYHHGELLLKRNISMTENNFTNLITVVFNNERIEVRNLQTINGKKKRNFNGTSVVFIDTNPNGALSCTYQLHQDIIPLTYSHGDLHLKSNCPMDQGNSVNLKTVLFNKKSVEVNDLESIILLDVKYTYDELNFSPNCSKEKNDFNQLKTIVLNDNRIEVKDLDDAKISQKEN